MLGAVVLLVFAGACATLAQPSPATVDRLLDSPHAEGAGPARRIVGRGRRFRSRTTWRRRSCPRSIRPTPTRKVLERMFEVQAVLARTYAIEPPRPARRRGIRRLRHDPLPAVRAGAAPRTSQWSALAREAARADGRRDPLVRRRAGPRRLPRRLRRPHERQQRRSGGATPSPICPAPPTTDPARGVAHGMDVRGLARPRCATRSMRIRAPLSGAELKAIDIGGTRLGRARRDRDARAARAPSWSAAKSSARSSPAPSASRACAARCSRSRRTGDTFVFSGRRLRPRRRPVPGRRDGPAPGRPESRQRARALFPGDGAASANGVWPRGEPDPEPRTATLAPLAHRVTTSSRRRRC